MKWVFLSELTPSEMGAKYGRAASSASIPIHLTLFIIPPIYEVCYGGIMFLSFLCVCVCVSVSVNNFRVRSITLKPLNIFS